MPGAPQVIIIGSGAGGAAAAYRLVLAGVNVLMLEKGAPLPRDGSTLSDEMVVTLEGFMSKEAWLDGKGKTFFPQEHFNLGGKTKWYGAAVLRYSAREFEPEPAYSVPGWPIAEADLAPYYEEAEALLGMRTFACEPGLKVILERLSAADSAWVSQPMPMALAEGIRSNRLEATHFDGFASVANLKGDAEVSFLKLIEGRPNFTLRMDAEVASLLPAESAARIAGVKLVSGEEIAAPQVLLAAGSLHSPRLLERYLAAAAPSAAASPSATAGAAQLSAVGRHLKKHVLTAMVAVSFRKQTDLIRKTMITTNRHYPHSSVQPLGFDGELIATLVPKFVPRFVARAVGRRAYGFFLQTEDGSHPDNRVYEQPAKVMDYDVARLPASLQEHKAFTRALQAALLRTGMLSFTQRVGLEGTAHVSGTLVAGQDANTAVVNAVGAVFGIAGLYVVDGSILPRSSRVNPSLSIYAWALRVGDLLAQSLGATA